MWVLITAGNRLLARAGGRGRAERVPACAHCLWNYGGRESAFIVHLISGRLFDSQTIVNYSSTCLRGRGGSLLMRAVWRLHLFPEYIKLQGCTAWLPRPATSTRRSLWDDWRQRRGREWRNGLWFHLLCLEKLYIFALNFRERERDWKRGLDGRTARFHKLV